MLLCDAPFFKKFECDKIVGHVIIKNITNNHKQELLFE